MSLISLHAPLFSLFKVNDLVSRADVTMESKCYKQMSKMDSSLRKQLYFFPGMNEGKLSAGPMILDDR